MAYSGEAAKPHTPYVFKWKDKKDNIVYIDGSRNGNLGSYINHSCDPNCTTEAFFLDGKMFLGVVSLKGIKPLEFLSLDYGANYSYFKLCLCGSPKCRNRDEFIKWVQTAPFPTHFITLPF